MLEITIKNLIDAAERDKVIRKELVDSGELDKPIYNERMKQCHEENADLLEQFLAQHGWPFPDQFGIEAHEAAWFIAIHAIGRPNFIKKIAELLKEAWQQGKLPGRYYVNFYDRIELYEGRLQRYGTHLFPSKDGWYAAHLENPEKVDTYRAEMGMPSLAEWIQEAEEGETGFKETDEELHAKEFDAWCKQVGWRK